MIYNVLSKEVIPTKNIIRDRRLELGLTMKEVADAVGVTEATVSRWESGDIANMKRSRIFNLANALQLSPLDILGLPGEEKQPSVPEGLSDQAIKIAELVDRLPPESRRLLLVQVQALARAIPDPASSEESPE